MQLQSGESWDEKAGPARKETCRVARWIGPLPSSYPRPFSAGVAMSQGAEVMRAFCRFSARVVIAIIPGFLATNLPLALFAQEASSSPSTSVAPRPLITQPVEEAQVTVLKGNTHRLARPEFDLGTAPATLPMQRMLLVLKRSPEQESALRKLLADQQDKASPNYHKWLTPEQFGQQFGPTDGDMQTITSWLQSHGFQVGTTKGRTVLEFSGSASQVKEAFHTSIHKYVVKGEQHWANSSDPSIPTALTPAVAGVLTLHNFLKKPNVHLVEKNIPAKFTPGSRPQFTAANGLHALTPADYSIIYNAGPVQQSGVNGYGITIGIVGRSNLFNGGQDVSDFQNVFGLPANLTNILLNGPDPGDLGGDEEAEATLDTSWSAALATDATVALVVSATTNTTDGIDLSELFIIENNFFNIMTESFGSCEADVTTTDAQGISFLAEQAAAQGITYTVSTGDAGAAGCDDLTNTTAQGPVSVNVLASTPFTVAVGGTMFNENGQDATYWNTTNNSSLGSAKSYIPEDVWNETCTTACGAGQPPLAAGAGGASVYFPKPAWQSLALTGMPNDGARDIPDVSLSAASHDPYLLCIEGSCVPNAQNEIGFEGVEGTSASAPSFAGIMALVEAKTGQVGTLTGGRQGLANYVLYALAEAQQANTTLNGLCNGSGVSTLPNSACVFNDLTVGNNSVPGEVGYPDGLYAAGAGFDLASGLGSVNVSNLANAWSTVSSAFRTTNTTLELNSSTAPISVSHGASVSVTIAVVPVTGTGTPTGTASLTTGHGVSGPSVAIPIYTLNAGSLTTSTTQLSGGNYTVAAYYAGDGTFGPSYSNPVEVTVTQEGSTTAVSAVDQNSNSIPSGTVLPFGSFVFVRADVAGVSGQGVPTGMVTFADSISASYAGDASFNSSKTAQPVTFTIQPGFAGISGPTNVTITSPGMSGTSTVSFIASSNFTTTVSFTCTGLPAEAACNSAPVAGSGPNTPVNVNITITTSAPHVTMLRRNQRQYYLASIFGGGLPLVGIFLLATPRRRR